MVKQIKEIFIDDIDGGEAVGTTRFDLDGTSYEIDLSQKNEDKLRKALAPYINAARPVRRERLARRRRGAGASERTLSRQRSKEIREWARKKGLAVSERGRIPANVIEQYEAAH
jgi:hypothetical protein